MTSYMTGRTLADDLRERGPRKAPQHVHFHSHGGRRHAHAHEHPGDDHAHSSRSDLPAHADKN